MATNNRTVIGGYIAPNGAVVEDIQYSPRSYVIAPPTINNRGGQEYVDGQSDRFSPAETYRLAADGYYNQGDTALGDAYSALWKSSDVYANTAKQLNDFYSELGNDTLRRELALAGVKTSVANKILEDMGQTKEYVMDVFGPNGSLTKELNKYYSDLSNYLATDAGRQAATIAAQGMHSGASLGAIRAQQNEAYNQSFQRYLQAREQELNAKQTIASNLINYMSTLRKEYGDTTNAYIISQYQRANDLLETLMQNIAGANAEIASTRLAKQIESKGSSSSSSSTNPFNSIITLLAAKALGVDEGTLKNLFNGNNGDGKDEPYTTVG